MKRRQFITLLGGAAALWPRAVQSQQAAMPVIGVLGPTTPSEWASRVAALHRGLGERGYAEGQNVKIEYRWADGRFDRLPALAADLVRSQVAVIASIAGTPGALAAKGATTIIPIVFVIGADPIKVGLVASTNRPGRNVTGASVLESMLTGKKVEVLHEAIPRASVIGFVVNPANAIAESDMNEVQKAVEMLGRKLVIAKASAESDFETAFAMLVQQGVGALLLGGDPLFNSRPDQLVALAARYAVPTMFSLREYVAAGGLMSYGASITEPYRVAGAYIGRILKGEKPADLPIQQATKVELIINLKTANALGIIFPLSLLGRADEVIE